MVLCNTFYRKNEKKSMYMFSHICILY